METALLSTDALALQVTAIATLLMYFKFVFTLIKQGRARARAGGGAPEDAKIVKKTLPDGPDTKDFLGDGDIDKKSDSLRWRQIVSNDIEQIPMGLIIAWGSLLTLGSSKTAAYIHIAAVCVFFAGRVGHTLCYANQIQPWRSVCFMIAVLAVLAMSVNAIVAAFSL